MPYRNKTYIAFDGDNDIKYYYLLKAWNENPNVEFDFYDAHDLTQSHDWALTESIKRSLKYRIDNSKLFILLIGEKTKRLTRFVQYEVETAIRQEIPIICVNLNGSKLKDKLAPNWMDNYPVISIPFTREKIFFTMKVWPLKFYKFLKEGKYYDYYYID